MEGFVAAKLGNFEPSKMGNPIETLQSFSISSRPERPIGKAVLPSGKRGGSTASPPIFYAREANGALTGNRDRGPARASTRNSIRIGDTYATTRSFSGLGEKWRGEFRRDPRDGDVWAPPRCRDPGS